MPNFRGNKDLCKLGKEYLNDFLCKFDPFCLQHSKTFDISHAFLLATIAELLTLKQVRFFGPPCICIASHLQHLSTQVSKFISAAEALIMELQSLYRHLDMGLHCLRSLFSFRAKSTKHPDYVKAIC